MYQKYFIILSLTFLISCDLFKKKEDRIPVARVNNSYLYFDDISDLIDEKTTKVDSTIIVRNYINSWAKEQLLLDGALINLSQEKQEAYNKLVKQYRNDLFTKAYMEALVKREIDTVVSLEEVETYFANNKEAFRLNENLIKLRYIHVEERINNFKEIRKRFKRFDSEDKTVLDSISLQFKSYSLNDSIWVRADQVAKKIPVITAQNERELLKKSNYLQLKDSLGVYLMKINDVLLRNDKAPMEYVKPTIEQIVINKRKLELIKKLEKDITTDAIKNKQFEIYK